MFSAGLGAPFRAIRRRETIAFVAGAAAAVSLGASALGYTALVWLAIVALVGFCLLCAHLEAVRSAGSVGGSNVLPVYIAGLLISVPFAVVASILLVAAASLGMVAAIGWVLWQLVGLLQGGRSTIATRTRKKHTHFNVDGSAKVEYASKIAASVAATKYERDFGQVMNTYPCAEGGHYHIGHAMGKKR